MDPSSSQTQVKQPIENSNENKENAQTDEQSLTNKGQNENCSFKDGDLTLVEFIVDNIKYSFDTRYMLWSTELLKQEKVQEQQNQYYPEADQIKKKSHKSMDLKKLYEFHKTQIEQLNKELHDLEDAKRNKKKILDEVKAIRDQQMKTYKIERQKTENIRGCRERLEKLKKELGF